MPTSIASLLDLGPRVAAVNFETFALAACDTLQSRVSLLALQVQKTASRAAIVRQQWRRCLQGLEADEVALQSLWVWCFVSATSGGIVPEKPKPVAGAATVSPWEGVPRFGGQSR